MTAERWAGTFRLTLADARWLFFWRTARLRRRVTLLAGLALGGLLILLDRGAVALHFPLWGRLGLAGGVVLAAVMGWRRGWEQGAQRAAARWAGLWTWQVNGEGLTFQSPAGVVSHLPWQAGLRWQALPRGGVAVFWRDEPLFWLPPEVWSDPALRERVGRWSRA